MTSSANPAARHSGRRFFGLVIVHLVVGVIGSSLWWYYDDSDLAIVREHARQVGCPVTWSDMRLQLADDERLQMWKGITEFSERLPSYQVACWKRKDRPPPYNVWEPIPQQLRDHHQSLDPVALNELATLLDRLGDQPLVLHGQLTEMTSRKESRHSSQLMRFMLEQMLLGDGAHAALWGRRMLATCRRYSAESLYQYTERVLLMESAITGLALRLADLKQSDPAIARDILNTTQGLHQDLLHALDGHFLMVLDACAKRERFLAGWYIPLVLRVKRQETLEALLAARQDLHLLDGPGSLTWARADEAKMHAMNPGFHYPPIYPLAYFVGIIRGYIYHGQMTALRGRLLAAELSGQSWPIDSFDPTGAALRPIVRDGRVIAAYSVDIGGRDHGGDAKRDRIMPLYADPRKP